MYVFIYSMRKLIELWNESKEDARIEAEEEKMRIEQAKIREIENNKRIAEIKKRREEQRLTVGVEDECSNDDKQCRICLLTEQDDPSKKLIRPCLCTGSQSYVHVECLNSWRATSPKASYTCGVCKYNYDIRRSSLSKWIISDGFSNIVTSIILFGIDIILGILLIYLDRQYVHLQPDIATMVLSGLLDFQIWWRDYSRPFTDFFVFDENWSWQILFRNSAVSCYVDVFMVGSTLVSIIGATYYVYMEVRRIYHEGFDDRHKMIALSSWVAQAFISRRFLRIPILMGHGLVTTAFYVWLLEYTQRHARYLGECILEPHQSMTSDEASVTNKAKQD